MYKWSYKKLLNNTAATAGAVLLAWLFLSWLEIISKNLTPSPVYSNINLLILLFKNLNAFLQGGIF